MAHVVDKSGWPRGVWDDEPDEEEFVHAGLQCRIHRASHAGGLCGYVRVQEGHPEYGSDGVCSLRVNLFGAGDCTYSGASVAGREAQDGEWWFGFDCAHSWHTVPRYADAPGASYMGGYECFSSVRNITERMAEQLAAMATTTESHGHFIKYTRADGWAYYDKDGTLIDQPWDFTEAVDDCRWLAEREASKAEGGAQ